MLTGVPISKAPRKNQPLLGVHRDVAIYLIYSGNLGSGKNVLTNLKQLPCHPTVYGGPRVVLCENADIDPIDLALSGVYPFGIPTSVNPLACGVK